MHAQPVQQRQHAQHALVAGFEHLKRLLEAHGRCVAQRQAARPGSGGAVHGSVLSFACTGAGRCL
jgi:hypothetical protein